MSTFQWWILLVIWDHIGRILGTWLIPLFWWGIWILIIIYHLFYHCHELVKFRVLFVKLRVIFLHFLLRNLPVVINPSLHGEELVIQIVIHLVSLTWYIEAWGMKDRVTEIRQLLWKVGSVWSRWALISEHPGEISVFATCFGLIKFGILDSRV